MVWKGQFFITEKFSIHSPIVGVIAGLQVSPGVPNPRISQPCLPWRHDPPPTPPPNSSVT